MSYKKLIEQRLGITLGMSELEAQDITKLASDTYKKFKGSPLSEEDLFNIAFILGREITHEEIGKYDTSFTDIKVPGHVHELIKDLNKIRQERRKK